MGIFRTIGVLLFAILSLCRCAKEDPATSEFSVEETQGYPAVVKVITPMGLAVCTGTFIAPNAVVTAAHCTQRNGPYRVISSFGTFWTSEKVNFGSGAMYSPEDVSLLVFPEAVADPLQGRVIPIGNAPRVQDEVRLVGFGCNDLNTKSGDGIKRTGTNRISEIDSHIRIQYREPVGPKRKVLGPMDQAVTCFGDSGGPLLNLQDGRLTLVGVAHGGGRRDGAIHSLFSDVNRSVNRTSLDNANAAYELQLYSGCWNELGSDRCSPSAAHLNIVSLMDAIFSWIKHLF